MCHLSQNPIPGSYHVAFCGDVIRFTLTLDKPTAGTAYLRTNVGHASIARDAIMRSVRSGDARLGEDWFDMPMRMTTGGSFEISVPLTEAGHFEAKAYFLPESGGKPAWPSGDNVSIQVKPARICGANTMYNAFVRLFGETKGGKPDPPVEPDRIEALDRAGYAVIPPSGTFRDLIEELDFILNDLGCRILLLLPVCPTPTTYARYGRFGSPYAALDFFTVDPALAEFDERSTPLDQFIELADEVHRRGSLLFLDIALNHTGWAADLHAHYPEWVARDSQGNMERPGAWGVTWSDLTRLDYRHRDLWDHMSEVLLTWCKRGVDGFRCDAGYMIPNEAWTYMIARVRTCYPQAVFLLEGLGGPPEVTRSLLTSAGFDIAYSELFQNYTKDQVTRHVDYTHHASNTHGLFVHFAETHDNPRLAAVSHTWARLRTALCALLSDNGAFGFACGLEWFAKERINVHEASSLNWDATDNQIDLISSLVRILEQHPAFHAGASMSVLHTDQPSCVAIHRMSNTGAHDLVVIMNLDVERQKTVRLPSMREKLHGEWRDLINRDAVVLGNEGSVTMDKGEAKCLIRTSDPFRLEQAPRTGEPVVVKGQRLRAKILEVIVARIGLSDVGGTLLDDFARQLGSDPEGFCTRQLRKLDGTPEPGFIRWIWPRDKKRDVMVPPDHFLLIQCPCPFRVTIHAAGPDVRFEEGIAAANGIHFVLVPPFHPQSSCSEAQAHFELYDTDRTERTVSKLVLLPKNEDRSLELHLHGNEISNNRGMFLGTNGRGAMMRSAIQWSSLHSRYDGVLLANPSDDYPADRFSCVRRFRVWMTYQDFSQSIDERCQTGFRGGYDSTGTWWFRVPTGQGQWVTLRFSQHMDEGWNRVGFSIAREYPQTEKELPADRAVTIIVRPDIEARGFHETVKAKDGAEYAWPRAVGSTDNGFSFAPSGTASLEMETSQGSFTEQPEWSYMIYHQVEAERGLDPHSDLFSPGYFETSIEAGGRSIIVAEYKVKKSTEKTTPPPSSFEETVRTTLSYETALKGALGQFIVTRDANHTVIAGYPWFLDWGRDTLIAVRGIIASGDYQCARSILKAFAAFERNGTLPNMIRGNDSSNRDTSDAALWFFIACSDLVTLEENRSFLDEPVDGRTIKQVLVDLANVLSTKAENGVEMDTESCLLFSPTHYTWMDTNHPAGTPRRGYPIEIQALWFGALRFLWSITRDNRWKNIAEKVAISTATLFHLQDRGFLSDCLHCTNGPAKDADADDALRPNQLLAITLGLVEDQDVRESILASCEELLVPGAIRSLSNRPVGYPIPIYRNGQLLNDPVRPYWGTYEGDEDTRRKPAYHNGTAWTWQFPLFVEAWWKTFGPSSRKTALAYLQSGIPLIHAGCNGHVPEILDGDSPHRQRGCDAQAWGVSELLRVWTLVKNST